MSNTLLDVFVDVGARGIPQTEQDLQDFINRIAAAFGGLNKGATTAVLNAGKTGAKKAAASIINELTTAVKEFELQKFEFDFQVRLLGDADIRRQLADLQSEVQAAKREFALATDDQSRRAAIDRVKAAQAELRLLEQIAEQARATQGLAGASPAAGDRAKVFQQIRADAATVNLELQQTGKLVGKAADPKLQLSFAGTREEAERLNLELRTAVQNKDFIGAENALQKLQLLRGAIATARSEAEDQIQLKIQVPDLKDEFKRVFGFLKFQLASGDLGSIKVLDATDREAAMRYRAEIAALSDEFGRLSARAELTSGDIARLQEIIEQLDSTRATTGPVAGLNQLQGKIGGAAKSFNSLNNNAYQFGQLIEDAAIGYELNGIAGALRGAGNNASFLLQTFIASRVEANQLSFKAGLILTTLSAVGVAAAMMIIPRMQEWLETLDDIDLKIKNIADKLRQEFADVRLRVDLQLDQEAEIRALAEVEDLVDGIEAILRRAQEQSDLQLKITAVLNEQSVQDLFTEATDATQQIADAAAQQIIALQARAQALASRAAAAGGRLPDFEQFLSADERDQIQQIEELQSAAEGFNQLRQQIFEDSKKGIVDPTAIEQARDALQTVIDSLEMLKGKLPEDEAKQLEENLAAARDEMKRLNDDAQRLQKIAENDAAAFAAISEAAKNIPLDMEFQARVNLGQFNESDRPLFDIEAQKRQLLELSEELVRTKGMTFEVEMALKNLAERTAIEITIKGETELRRLNDEAVDLAEQIQRANDDIAKNAAEAAERRVEAEKKAAEKIASLQARMQEMAARRIFDAQRSQVQDQIDFLRSQMDEFQPDQFAAGTLGTAIGGTGKNQIDSEIAALEAQLQYMDRQQKLIEEIKQIAEITNQISDARKELTDELTEIDQKLIEANTKLEIEMRDLGDQLARLEEQEAELTKAIRTLDMIIWTDNAPGRPGRDVDIRRTEDSGNVPNVITDEMYRKILGFDDDVELLFRDVIRPPEEFDPNKPVEWIFPDGIPPQTSTSPQFRPEEPVFAPEDVVADATDGADMIDQSRRLMNALNNEMPDFSGLTDFLQNGSQQTDMQRAQAQAMDAALSSADFKSSSLEGLIDQSNRLLSTLGDAVMKLDVTARYA